MSDEHTGFVAIPPDLLAHATAEEREAYYQYLLGNVIAADEWEPWIRMIFPQVAEKPFSEGHQKFWEWVWQVEPGTRPKPWVSIWPRGHGKRLKSSTPILTTEGWTTQGQLNIGDEVFGPDGTPAAVTWVGPETMRPLYRVRFTDGTELVADPEHEWTVLDRGPYEWRTLETQEIAAQRYYSGGRARFMLPHRDAIQAPRRDLLIDPYLLGYWLGDGNHKTGVLAAGSMDDANEVALNIESRGELIKNRYTQANTGCNYIVIDGLRNRLSALGLLGNKHIPSGYLTSSEEQRRALLAGLVDSDGHVDKKRGRVRYVSHDQTLAEAVRLLARTLGYNATVWSEIDDREPHPVTDLDGVVTMVSTAGTRWVASWTPHDGLGQGMLARKVVPTYAKRQRVGIESITPVESEPGLCIEVDRDDGLYLAGSDLIPTHNSTSSELAVVVLAARRKRRYGIYVSETQDQADDHVANVAAMLESPTIELAYPDLGERLMGKFGTSKGWRRNRIRTKTGFTLDAMGLDSAARGVKLEDQRPDFMVFDDIDGELDTDERVEKKIKTITRKLLPAGSQDCAILMVQNLVHENSIFARLSDGRADFLRDRIVSGPIPAIWDLEYEELEGKFVITGGEPSWPEGFPIPSCQLLMNDIGLSAFLAECQHETKPPEGDIFNHIAFVRVEHHEVPPLRRAVVWVDPAVTSTDSSDSMGIQCDGLGVDDKIYRLFSWENRSTPYRAIHLAIEKALEYGADTVGVETNQGGDLWRVVYDQACEDIRNERGDRHMKMPRYRQEKATADLGSKVTRAERMLVDYERGLFVHVEGTHHTLEMALRRFPKVKPFDLVDACLVAGTLVATPDGEVPIESIVPGDFVWTRQGAKRVLNAGPTRFDAEVYELVTEDGRSVVGTGDHLVWTHECGWVPLALAAGLTVSIGSWTIPSRLNTPVGAIAAIPMPNSAAIGSTTCPSGQGIESTCTERSTSITSARFPRGGMFTTSMVTPSTTTPEISGPFHQGNIVQPMGQHGQTHPTWNGISQPSEPWPPSGTDRQKGSNGIPTTDAHPGRAEPSINSNVFGVERHSRRLWLPRGSALSDADTGSSRPMNQTRTPGPARSAEAGSSLNDGRPPAFAASLVVIVQPRGSSAVVYDLEVEDAHEFLADGVVVHNCYWSWAYLAGPLHRRKAKVRSSARKYLNAAVGIGNAPAGFG